MRVLFLVARAIALSSRPRTAGPSAVAFVANDGSARSGLMELHDMSAQSTPQCGFWI
jgi:hypothetical protein